MNFIVLAEYLKNIRDDKMYEGQWESFDDFLADVDIQKSMASKMIISFEVFVDKWNVPRKKLAEVGYSKLYLMAPHVRECETKESVYEFISKAGVLSARDLEKEMHEEKTGIEMRKCKHKDTYTIRVCRDCGDRERIYD